MTTSPPTQLMLWQPSRRSVHAIVASVRGSLSSPLSLSVLMSPFWQNAQRMLHEVKKIVPEPCVRARTGRELAGADTAIPGTEIAVGEHAVGELAGELQQARPVRRRRQRRARADRLPARDKDRREAVEFGPQRVLAARRRIKRRGHRR